MAFAKLLALVTAALVSAAPAPNNSTKSTGTQASTVKVATVHTDHSIRSLGAEFEEHWGGCRTRIGSGTGEGTHDTHWKKDKQSCKNICLDNRRCAGFEWQPGIPFLRDDKCEIHFDNLIGGAGLDFPGILCFIRKKMPDPQPVPQIEMEQVEYIKIYNRLIQSKEIEAGTLKFSVVAKQGYQHTKEVNAQFYAEVTAQTGGLVSLAGGKVGGKLSLSISASYNIQFTGSETITKEFIVEPGSKAYIYQSMVEARTNLGTTLSWGGGLILTDEPLHLVEEKHMPVMNLLGQGYCSGFDESTGRGWEYAGYDGKGIDSHRSCAELCLEDARCKFAAFSPGKTCNRYPGAVSLNDRHCHPNGVIDHVVYMKGN